MCTVKECYLVEVGFGFETNGERGFSRGSYIPYRTINNFIEKHSGYSVFRSAYRYNDSDISKSDLFGDLYLDFDDVKSFENVRKDALTTISFFNISYHIPPEQLEIYFSGGKGIHIIVPAKILGIEPMRLLNGVFKHIALSAKAYTPNKTIDTQIYDNRRLFRIPNTRHEKSNLYKIPITHQELKSLSEDEIKELAKQPRELERTIIYETNNIAQRQFQRDIQEYMTLDKEAKKDKRFKTTLNFTPPCIKNILENGAEEGQRNVTIACLTGFCKSSGKSLNETIEFISEWNSNNTKPTGEQEMKKTIRSIFMGDKMFGCSTLKLLSVCNESICRLSKKKEGQNNVIRSESNKNQTK